MIDFAANFCLAGLKWEMKCATEMGGVAPNRPLGNLLMVVDLKAVAVPRRLLGDFGGDFGDHASADMQGQCRPVLNLHKL